MHNVARATAAAMLAACAFGAAAQQPATPLVHVQVLPRLLEGDRVEVLVDGLPSAAPSKDLDFRLPPIAPGDHVLQARIIDWSGNVGGLSEKDLLQTPWGPGDVDLVAHQFHIPLE